MNSDELRDVFDRMAAGYDDKQSRMAPVYDSLYFLLGGVLAGLPREARILCVGVGTGTELLRLAEEFPEWRFTAVEPSGAMLDICRRRIDDAGFSSRCQIHEGYVESLPTDQVYHAATCFLVSQFILDREERSAFFRGISQRLMPGGALVNVDLSADVESDDYDALLAVWHKISSGSDGSAEALARMKAGYAKDVAVLPADAVASIIVSGGFAKPVSFFQATLLRGWFATNAASGTFPVS